MFLQNDTVTAIQLGYKNAVGSKLYDERAQGEHLAEGRTRSSGGPLQQSTATVCHLRVSHCNIGTHSSGEGEKGNHRKELETFDIK